MKKIFFTIIIFCWPALAFCQQTIHGRVLDMADKSPLPGATIRIHNSEALSIAASDGTFSLPVPGNNAVIDVTFAGFKSKQVNVAFPQSGLLTIYMETDPKGLREIVISTGYQEISKERSTGSFSKIDNSVFNQQVSSDVLSRLEPIASAVMVDHKSNSPGISIRGLSTIQGITGPLIVLDNFPYDGDVNNINPNDVESITLLKDAAAASIWGTKAGNGVIVITTKKGKFNQPLGVDFNTNISSGPKPGLDYFKNMSSSDYVGVEKMLFNQGFYDFLIDNPSHPALSPVIEALAAQRNGTLSAADAQNELDVLSKLDSRKQFERCVYRQPFTQQYAIDIHGGSQLYSWLASAGWDKNIGTLSDRTDRLNLHYQLRVRPIKNLEISSEIWYTQSNSLTGRPAYGDINNYPNYPYLQLADQKGNPIAVARDYSLSYLNSINQPNLLDWRYYPLTDYRYDRTSVETQDVLINLGLNYKILPGLAADIKYRYERQAANVLANHQANSYYSRNLINSYTAIDSAAVATNNIPLGGIEDLNNTDLVSNNVRAQLSYNQTLGKNAINVIGGGEIRNAVTSFTSSRFYGVNTSDLATGPVDYLTSFSNYITGEPNYVPYLDGLGSLTSRYVSVFANAAYTYKDRYTISISGRRDASNLFGVNTNQKWTPLWSAGGGWNISKESFYKVDWLPYLKLRGSFGYSGNVDPNESGNTVISYLGNSIYTGQPYARVIKYPNPDLRWEKVSIANLGVDFATHDNRISGSVEYYHKVAKDLFGPALIDYTTGIGVNALRNVASMSGNGFDVEVNTLNTTGTVKWSSNLLFSIEHEQITSYNADQSIGSNFVGPSTGLTLTGIVGKPVYSILSYKWAGLDPQNGDPRGYSNGQVSKDYASIVGAGTPASDLVYGGSAMPTVFGSIGNTVAWANLSLTMRITYKFGYYFRRPTLDYNALFNSGIGNVDFSKRWQQPGDEKRTNVPSMVYPDDPLRDLFYDGSSINVDKGDNIRLQYVTLSYQVSGRELNKLPFHTLTFYASANNLGILWRANKDGLDPDYTPQTLPPSKIYSLGIKGSF